MTAPIQEITTSSELVHLSQLENQLSSMYSELTEEEKATLRPEFDKISERINNAKKIRI